MNGPSPGLAAARAVAQLTGSSIYPATLPLDGAPENAVLLADEPPTAEQLATYAHALPGLGALVMWCAGWDADQASASLGEHGFEHGSVDILGGDTPGALCVLAGSEARAQELIAELPKAQSSFRVLAILPAYNEADVIFHSVGALISEGVDVYLLDHRSTDGTVEAVKPWLGRGLVHIERFPDESGYDERNGDTMVWTDILRRVEELSGELAADWYTFTNADEFREAPWAGMSLAAGIREVDRLGYSAINFDVFDFRPVDDSYVPGRDPRDYLLHYQPPGKYDRLQIKAWKRQPVTAQVAESGGHDISFPGRRVFPVPFILRHYPIRSNAHGERKIRHERMPRFAPEERAKGWHVQYDDYASAVSYLHDAATMLSWNADAARAALLGSALRELLLVMTISATEPGSLTIRPEEFAGWMTRSGVEMAPSQMTEVQEHLGSALQHAPGSTPTKFDTMARELAYVLEVLSRVRGDLSTASTVNALREALSPAG